MAIIRIKVYFTLLLLAICFCSLNGVVLDYTFSNLYICITINQLNGDTSPENYLEANGFSAKPKKIEL